MYNWQWVSLILCTFGLLKELRPSEPFITEYIIDFKNVTAYELIHVAFPVSTYSSMTTLLIVFLVTDFARYRCVVIFEAFVYILTWTILVFGKDLKAIIFVEIFYGIACSAEVAYYTYMYAQVDKKYYKKVTSHTSSALYSGKFLGGLFAQVLVTYKLMNYHQLTCVTLAFSVLGFICTLFLPKVKTSIYFHPPRIEDIKIQDKIYSSNLNNTSSTTQSTQTKRLYSIWNILWKDFNEAYANTYILKWSIWWALASAGQYQVVNYVQALWEKINEESSLEPYNGAIKALHTLISALMCFAVGYMKLNWNKFGESFLASISVLQGLMLIWMSKTSHLYISYLSYTIFRSIHPVMLTIASAEVAQGISKDSHGLIFGMNTFFALIFQTILTIIVSDKNGFAFDVKEQFFIYGIYFLMLGSLFLIACTYSAFRSMKIRPRQDQLDYANNLTHLCEQTNNCQTTGCNCDKECSEVLLQIPIKE